MRPACLPFLGAIAFISPLLSLSTAAQHSITQALRDRHVATPGRNLKAATKAANLVKRHLNFYTSNELDMSYSESRSIVLKHFVS